MNTKHVQVPPRKYYTGELIAQNPNCSYADLMEKFFCLGQHAVVIGIVSHNQTITEWGQKLEICFGKIEVGCVQNVKQIW